MADKYVLLLTGDYAGRILQIEEATADTLVGDGYAIEAFGDNTGFDSSQVILGEAEGSLKDWEDSLSGGGGPPPIPENPPTLTGLNPTSAVVNSAPEVTVNLIGSNFSTSCTVYTILNGEEVPLSLSWTDATTASVQMFPQAMPAGDYPITMSVEGSDWRTPPQIFTLTAA